MAAATTIDTKKAPRRNITYRSMDDLWSDLDRIEAAHADGTLRHTGNWTPGEVCDHVAILMECALDGFPSKAPAPVRWIITAMYKKKAISGGAMPAGFKIPKQASFLIPRAGISFEDGLARLRTVADRVRTKGEKFTHPSPVFGKLTHEEWTKLQLGHAAGHLSFLDPDGSAR